jgi:chitinase
VYTQSGQKDFVLAFAIGSSEGCVAKWGGQVNLDDPSILGPVRQIQAVGGRLIVATGGAMGPYFEQLCTTVDTLAGAYKNLLDTVKTNHLDVDIESTVNADLVNQALARVQSERPGTTVSYTLMVQAEDYGLTPALGVDILKNAKKNGVRVDYVNPMTMEFGGPSADFGDSVINAAKSTLIQMKEIWPEKSDTQLKKMLSVTPMIGRNFNGKVFELNHGRKLVSWANQNGIGRLHFWSVGRDNGKCSGGGVSATCSSVSQGDYEFTKTFQGFRP